MATSASISRKARAGNRSADGVGIIDRDVSAKAFPKAGVGSDDLRELMQTVTEAAERLQVTHVSLQNQVARLQQELAEANAALRRSQALAALGEMAAGIAHEVRNPLGSIQLYVQMLAEDLADRPAQAELCFKIDRAVIGLDAIVRDVLAFARDTTVHPRLTTADELFDAALSNSQSLLTGKLSLCRNVETGPLQFPADVGLLAQALGNVIRNGIEAMNEANSDPRQLRLSASQRNIRSSGAKPEPKIVLAIADTGPGVPAEVMDRIFNPFFTTRATGTGLGLAIVHRIIDAHGGHINIHNIPAGGTQVEICLPIKSPAAASRHALMEQGNI